MKALGLIALAASVALPALAQEQEKQATGKEKQSGSTLMGCLEEADVPGGYVLAAGTKEGVAVMGSADLKKHVGHTVKLTGEEYKAEGKTHFEVNDIEHIAATCEKAELAPKAAAEDAAAEQTAGGATARAGARQETETSAKSAEQQSSAQTGKMMTARATLKDPQGETVGQVQLTETQQGVLIKADFMGLPEGTHALHIHQNGKCEAPSFESAGGHFNPTDASHGFLAGAKSHAGDMPNFDVPSSGKTTVEVLNSKVTLKKGEENSASGKALMVHSGADDYKSQPSGDAGDRIACGVIE